MSDTKFAAGDTATCHGIMAKRQGQEVQIGSVSAGLIACTFPDQAVIGCAPSSLRR